MYKISLFFLFAILSLSVCAKPLAWNLVEVLDKSGNNAGYIYHTSALNTQTTKVTEKVASSLRLICAATDSALAIYWDRYFDTEVSQTVTTHVDGKLVSSLRWAQDGKLLYIPTTDTKDIIRAMRAGRIVTFHWHSPTTQYAAFFALDGFSDYLGDFEGVCKISL